MHESHRGVLVQPLRLQRAAHREQQRGDRRVHRQRQVLGMRGGGYAGLVQGALQRREEQMGRPDHDRHPRPGHPVDQVGLAQPVRHVGGLARRRPERVRLRAAGRQIRIRVQEPVPDRPAQPGGHPLGRPQQIGALPVGAGQVDRPGLEPVGEVGHPARVGAAEGVDRGVRVGERDQVRPAPGHQAQQVELRGVGVGQLVDVDRGQPAPLQVEQLGFGKQEPGRRAQQLGRIVGDPGPAGRVAQRQDLEVLAQEPGRDDPVGAPVGLPERGQLLRRDAPLGAAHQQVTQLGGERAGAQRRAQRLGPRLRIGGQQLADHQVLLGAGQQPRRRVAELGCSPSQDAESVGVERAHQRLGRDVLRHPGLDPVAQPGRTPPAERQDQDLVGRRPLGDPRRD